jgi:hypothetical protein
MKLLTVVGGKGPALGIGAIDIDGGAAQNFDCYAPRDLPGASLFFALVSDAAHTVHVVATGTKNAASSGTAIAIDNPAQLTEASLMGSLSPYLLDKLTDHTRGVAAYTRPATVYLRLFSAGTELSGSGYAAKAITNNTTNFPNAAARTKTLATTQAFAASTAQWQFDEVRIYDAAAGGNMLAYHSVGSVTVPANGVYAIDGSGGSQLAIVAPAAGIVTAELDSILDHVFGGPDYTAKATTYGAYYAGDPQGAGAQAGARVAITNDGTQWSASVSGITRSLADITLTAQPTATHWSEWDAAAAGNLLWSTTLPEVPTLNTIVAGKLRFKLY